MVEETWADMKLRHAKQDIILARKHLERVMLDAKKKIIKKELERGNSWQKMSFDFMWQKMENHYAQLVAMYDDPNHKNQFEFYQQLLDVQNYAKILAAKVNLEGYKDAYK